MFHGSQLLRNTIKIICCLILPALLITGCYDDECFEAMDYGKGTKVTIFANPLEQPTTLLLSSPLTSQVSRWIDTGYFVTGSYEDYTGATLSVPIKMQITGQWFPWGSDGSNSACQMAGCASNDMVCLTKSNVSGNISGLPGNVVQTTGTPLPTLPCYLTGAIGLYGLVSEIKEDGTYQDPNQTIAAASNPHTVSGLHSFHVSLFPDKDSSDGPSDGTLFAVDKIATCTPDDVGRDVITCNYDTKQPSNQVVGGRLYFKLLDNYYADNAGGYDITLLDGIYHEGIVSKILRTIQTTLTIAEEKIFTSVIDDGDLRPVIKVCLIMYICFIAISYMLGMAGEEVAAEIVKKVFKITVISMLLYNGADSYNVFTQSLVSWFDNIGNGFSNLISKTLFAAERAPDQTVPSFLAPTASYMSIYDQLIQQLLSQSINAKIQATFFTWRFFYWFFLLYALVVMLILFVFKAVSLYIIATFQITILTLLLPIILILALFKKTYKFFSSWLTSAASSGLLIILVTAVSALMVALVGQQLADLFYYRVCGDVIWRIETWDILSFWKLCSQSQTRIALSMSTYLECVLTYAVFNLYMNAAPKIADALASSAVGTSSAAYDVAARSFASFKDGAGSYVNSMASSYRTFRQGVFDTKDYSVGTNKDGSKYVKQGVMSKIWFGGFGDSLFAEKKDDSKTKKFFKAIGRTTLNQISVDLPVRMLKGVGSLSQYIGAGMNMFDKAMENRHNDTAEVDVGINKALTEYAKKLKEKADAAKNRLNTPQQGVKRGDGNDSSKDGKGAKDGGEGVDDEKKGSGDGKKTSNTKGSDDKDDKNGGDKKDKEVGKGRDKNASSKTGNSTTNQGSDSTSNT